ncbi:MAG TPA: sirohydrochlorin chelatase [Trebonia sp.]|jgi:sirohydrochlorin ferrochelatase|nr:sirohydrochlorin chelatase [Trebonia sp.]
MTQPAPLVAVAHGSKDPRAAATITDLVALVRDRAGRAQDDSAQDDSARPGGLTVQGAFLDHCVPALPGVLSALAGAGQRDVVLVPLLLTAAYHSNADIPARVAAATAREPGLAVRQAAALGPHPLLAAALERRLAEAGADRFARADTSVVLAAAGSSDPRANARVAAFAGRWQAAGGWRRVVPAFASAASPSPAQAVAGLRGQGGPVVVATYLLAPGYFADKVRAQALAAGAALASAPLGVAPEVADLVLERYAALAAPARNATIPHGTAPGRALPEPGRAGDGYPPARSALGRGRTLLRNGSFRALRFTRTRDGRRRRGGMNNLAR